MIRALTSLLILKILLLECYSSAVPHPHCSPRDMPYWGTVTFSFVAGRPFVSMSLLHRDTQRGTKRRAEVESDDRVPRHVKSTSCPVTFFIPCLNRKLPRLCGVSASVCVRVCVQIGSL